MECYEGANMIKTFRGLIAADAQDTIVLHTNKGEMGYRIVKFQLMFSAPGTQSVENVVKIYKVSQTVIDGAIDFSENTLIGAGWIAGSTSATYGWNTTVVFDSEIFNQDIYITHKDLAGVATVNYYLELEQVKLDLNENTVATLKNLKNLEPGG